MTWRGPEATQARRIPHAHAQTDPWPRLPRSGIQVLAQILGPAAPAAQSALDAAANLLIMLASVASREW